MKKITKDAMELNIGWVISTAHITKEDNKILCRISDDSNGHHTVDTDTIISRSYEYGFRINVPVLPRDLEQFINECKTLGLSTAFIEIMSVAQENRIDTLILDADGVILKDYFPTYEWRGNAMKMKLILNATGNDSDFADHMLIDLGKEDIQTLISFIDKMGELVKFNSQIYRLKAMWGDTTTYITEDDSEELSADYNSTEVCVSTHCIYFVVCCKYSDLQIISADLSRDDLEKLLLSDKEVVDLRKND